MRRLCFALLLVAGCRDDLCDRTASASCVCDDPSTSITECTAYYDVVGCGQVDLLGVDICKLSPCCMGPHDAAVASGRDAAHPADLSASVTDGPHGDAASDGGAHEDLAPRDEGSAD